MATGGHFLPIPPPARGGSRYSSTCMSSPAPALKIEQLTRRFGDVTAVDAVEFEVAEGELTSILGPSGCGKSTLLQLIAGHLVPDAGSITIAGTLVARSKATNIEQAVAGPELMVAPQHRRVGMVFQDYALFPHLSVAENVAFALPSSGRILRRGARREQSHMVATVLEQMEITHLATRRPGELSGGQQQRVAIARALAQRPQLLLLDEPFSNLDSATREHVRTEIVGLLRSTGLACVFVTHDQEEALAISDKVAVMQQGRMMQVDEPEVLYRRPFCREVAEFLGRTNIVRGHATGSRVATRVGSFDLFPQAFGDVQVVVRPELLDLVADPNGTALVLSREFRGHDAVYTLALDGGKIVQAHRPSVDMVSVGDRVRIVAQPGYAALIHPDATPALESRSEVADPDDASATDGLITSR
jgi:iron(III) transport system ATP-binding protein